MEFVADLHLHSRFSRATAKNLDLEHVYQTAQLKGITLVGTGDFTHPEWFRELVDKLEPAEEGLYRLKPALAEALDRDIPKRCRGEVRFILQCEISSIYKKDNRVRKNHNLIYFPDLDTVNTFNERLDKIGNITSDGRPILGLDAEKLLEIMLETSDEGFLIPAHIWTPWFSMFGSKSGFDSIEECFGALSSHIFAVETGLSSDPPMNWRVADLDGISLISSSDAHSPMYMGRNASRFDTELSYVNIREALRSTWDSDGYLGTIDMYPEEGKYHFDGHRNCQVALHPSHTRTHGGICPECGKPMTLGVLYRVQELASREEGYRPEGARGYERIVPLAEMLSELCGVGPKTKKVTGLYSKALEKLGPELDILLKRDIDEIETAGIPLLAQAMERLRSGNMHLTPGFDGEFGSVKLFSPDELEDLKRESSGELNMFFAGRPKKIKPEKKPAKGNGLKIESTQSSKQFKYEKIKTCDVDVITNNNSGSNKYKDNRENKCGRDSQSVKDGTGDENRNIKRKSKDSEERNQNNPELNPEQQQAVTSHHRPLLMEAGPGTGKTHTLTEKIASLIVDHDVSPGAILALTFTNKAADEMCARIKRRISNRKEEVVAATFHGFCLMVLKEYTDFQSTIIDGTLRVALLAHAVELEFPDGLEINQTKPNENEKNKGKKTRKPSITQMVKLVDTALTNHLIGRDMSVGQAESKIFEEDLDKINNRYRVLLQRYHLVDLDELIPMVLTLLQKDTPLLKTLNNRFPYIFVDEYQDINQGQYRLIKTLAGSGEKLCVIGDPDQSIYGFRGSDHRYFNRFERDYPAAEKIVFKRNYRSTETILQASYQLISMGDEDTHKTPTQIHSKSLKSGIASDSLHAPQGEFEAKVGGERQESKGNKENRDASEEEVRVKLFSDIDGAQHIQILEAATEKAEAVMIGKTIEQLIGGFFMESMDGGSIDKTRPDEYSFSDMAVLYRTRYQSDVLSEVFQKAGIPFQTADRENLFLLPGIRELISFIRLTLDRGTFYDIEILMDHIERVKRDEITQKSNKSNKKKKSRRQLKQWFYSHEMSCLEALKELSIRHNDWSVQLVELLKECRVSDEYRFYEESEVSEVFPLTDGSQPVSHVCTDVPQSGPHVHQGDEEKRLGGEVKGKRMKSAALIDYAVEKLQLDQLVSENEVSLEFLKKMKADSQSLSNPLQFYEALALKKDPDIVDEGAEKVHLMTMHAAKGLEFKVVFVAGCVDGLTPYHQPGKPCDGLNEERRLFYVAMTRAEQILYLCRPGKRTAYGKTVVTQRSPFLDDIEETLKAYNRSKKKKEKKAKVAEQLELF